MVDGLEEGKSQDVVQMGMREKDVIVISLPSLRSLFPNRLIPDPASTIMISSFLLRISRQVVSPPYLTYSSPETGIEPLAP